MPSAVAVSLKEEVFAARQPDSDPVWMNPTVMSLYVYTFGLGDAADPEQAARAPETAIAAAIRSIRDIIIV